MQKSRRPRSSGRRVAILGAGISGLTRAYFLQKQNPDAEIFVLERRTRVGGVVDSWVRKEGIYEWGPRGLRPYGKGQIALDFIRELGLWNEMVLADSRSKRSFILANGRLEPVPFRLRTLALSTLHRGALGAASAVYRDLKARPNGEHEESVGEFAKRRFGKEIQENLFESLVSGIWAGDADRLSVQAALPQLARIEKEHGSVIRGLLVEKKEALTKGKVLRTGRVRNVLRAGLYTFKGGMSRLCERIAEELGSSVVLGCSVNRILPLSNGGYKIQYERDGRAMKLIVDEIVSTLPAYVLAEMMEEMSPDLARELRSIEYAPLAVVPLAFERKVNRKKGFGYLVRKGDRQATIGVEWNDQTFPSLNQGAGSSFTVLLGGGTFSNFDSFDREYFMRRAQKELCDHLEIQDEPSFIDCRIYSRALPQYNLGHLDRVKRISELAPERFQIAGNFIGGVAIADIIRNSKEWAEGAQP